MREREKKREKIRVKRLDVLNSKMNAILHNEKGNSFVFSKCNEKEKLIRGVENAA